MTKTFASLISALIVLSTLSPQTAFAQKRNKSGISPYSAPAAESSSYSSSYGHKTVEIASNQVFSGGLSGGGINSAMSINTASGSSVLFGISAEGNFNIAPDWQISVPLFLFASSSTTFGLNVGPQYNWGEGGRMKQFFANLRPGFVTGGGETSFIVNGTIGKRFEILNGLAYRPNFGITWNAGAGDVEFNLAPFALSFEI